MQLSSHTFEQWFHQHYAELCRFAMSYLSDPDEARDTVQQVFVRMWEQRSKLPETLKLRAYLFTAVRNSCVNALEHKKVRHIYAQHAERHGYSAPISPEELLQAQELNDRIQSAIASLPDRCREAFLLSREEGLTYKEIAERMGISRKTVEIQIGKALKLLREHLGDALVLIYMTYVGTL